MAYMKKRTCITFVNDGKYSACGLVDLLRGIVSLYHYCKNNNIIFKIEYTYPFLLTKYLKPNKYNWLPSDISCIDKNRGCTVNLLCEGKDGEDILHRNILDAITANNLGNNINIYTNTTCYDKDFSSDFKELFTPTKYLSELIEKNLSLLSSDYNSVSCRFCATLGDFPDILSPLKEQQQLILINKFKQKVKELASISKESFNKLLVTSDSMKFISVISDLDNVQIIPGSIVHSRNSMDADGIDKVFVEFFLISLAKRVYSITSDGLFPGAYSYYASKLGNAEYIRLKV